MHRQDQRVGTAAVIHPDVEKHIPAIRALCREFGIARLEIFGSAVTDEFDTDRSDVDFLVTYPDDYDFGLWLARFFRSRARVVQPAGRDVDLIMSAAPKNPRFIASANRGKVELFNAAQHAHVA